MPRIVPVVLWPQPCRYGAHMREIEERSQGRRQQVVPEYLSNIVTPLKPEVWQRELADYPEKSLAELVVRGIECGFRIGYEQERCSLRPKRQNMVSAAEQEEVVTQYLAKELEGGRIAKVGSMQEAEELGIHCSPFGVIPKRNKPGQWRLIVNLSAPEGGSVNDGIDRDLASLSYVSVDEVAEAVLNLGRGTQMAKMDIRQAYRNVPVHPQDRLLLGMQWRGQVYVDATLPFGLRSAPLIFTVVADMVQWIMQRRGIANVFHYIDDFIALGMPGTVECEENNMIMHETCTEVGLPADPVKDEGPATTITFTGIEIDSDEMVLRLPQAKLARLRAELISWRGRKACKKRELLSLIGVLAHACKAVRAGRTFLRRLIDLSTVVKHLDHHVRLSKEARSDIEWWFQFSEEWNGVAIMRGPKEARASVTLTSDASGGWGCGAFCGIQWFMLKWAGSIEGCHITVKELVPIVIAAAVWGSEWQGRTVQVWCDNAAVVAIINQGSSRNKEAMHLARCLAFVLAKREFEMVATHIKGVDNSLADALSRDNLPLFRSLFPQAAPTPTAIPPALLDMLLISKPDWTSKRWTNLWSTIF